jgi:Glycosyl transferase family 2
MTAHSGNPLTISLVTPNHNGVAYIADCLDSVAGQNYAGLEHVVVDGASTDGSLVVIEARRHRLSHITSEPDGGHADALNKGFARTTGEIMGWLNSDDMLHAGCLETVARVFSAYPEVSWITGRPSSMNARGEVQFVGPTRPWSRLRFLSGDHLWIQQESTFWRRELWEAAGGFLDTGYSVANDFDLWARFFRHAELHSVDRMLGCFRVRPGQRSVTQSLRYDSEARHILKRELDGVDDAFKARHGDLLSNRPVQLDAAAKALSEDRLRVDDPPIIHVATLRTDNADRRHPGASPVPATGKIPASKSDGSVRDTLRRNAKFIASIALAIVLSGCASVAFEALRVWIALALGIGLCLGTTAAVAVKTRRIVLALDRAVGLALADQAAAEMRAQTLELEIDRLKARVGK